MKKPASFAYLLIADGTRKGKGGDVFFRFVEEFRKVFSHRRVEPAFLEVSSSPSIAEALEACVEGGAKEIFVLPVILSSNRRAQEGIPAEVQAGKRRFPEVDFHYPRPFVPGSSKRTKLTRSFSSL